MSWLVVIAIEPLFRSLHPEGLLLLILGGLAYTLGLAFYGWRQLPYNHAVWHVFVLVGGICHFFGVALHVLPAAS